MPPEQVEEIRAWLIKAARDLEAARRLIETEEPLLDIVVYHCQQAMEKALKGFLTLRMLPLILSLSAFRKKQDLRGLCKDFLLAYR